ncbi:hypothetical protein [Synechococcus sp. MIT S1220]|uniref:hypothetical protein n=1 Tax=Synechococcus sp. MIT S1220 TaxID=3082549 RepID=UPI0039B02212
MGRSVAIAVSAALLSLNSAMVHALPRPQLNQRQTILEANRYLIADGWRPAPQQTPSPQERAIASVSLASLSACSGSGVGFCRYDYVREQQTLSVVTVPSDPGKPSVGRVERWW